MPIPRRKIQPTVPPATIRARFKSVINANLYFLASWAIVSAIDFVLDEAIFIFAIPVFVLYIANCIALGRLASCFGESSTSWAFGALLFYIPSAVLAFFAFGNGVSDAFVFEDQPSETDSV